MHSFEIVSCLDEKKFIHETIEKIKKISDNAIRLQNIFNIVLSGGNTPREIYKNLIHLNTDWSKWRFWFGDERCLPEKDPNLNSAMVEEVLLKFLPLSKGQVFPIPSSLGPYSAAEKYSEMLSNIPDFDLVLLGIGEDGHTASLFPGNDIGETDDSPDAIPVVNAVKQPKNRISLSANRLNRSREVLFLIKGIEKKEIIYKMENGCDCPASKIIGKEGTGIVYCID